MAKPKIPLVVATTNPGKAREIRAALSGLPYQVLTLADIGVASAYPERGATFEANARAKSAFYSRKSGHLTLADDSGLDVEALRGGPGVRSARFSGRGATDARNRAKLLRVLEGVPPERRGARFVCAMALAKDGRVLKVVRGQVRGRIIDAPRGAHGFGYDPLFYYRPWRRTFAEIPLRRKNSISHRGRAIARMAAFLAAQLG